MNRRISVRAGAALLALVLAATVLWSRALRSPEGAAGAAPHERVAGFEPGAENVSPQLVARLHSLRKRVEAQAEDTAVLLELARLLHDAHRPADAVPYYRRYLEHNPGNGEVWFDLADVHGRAGDWPAARAVMASRLELDPDDAAVLYNLGAIEAALGNVAAARGFFEKAAADTQAPAVARQAREALAALEKKP